MFFHAVSTYSSESEAAAISQALSMASVDYGHEAKSIHVIVDAVFKMSDGWKAVVRVLVEPDLELEESESLKIEDRMLEKIEAQNKENLDDYLEELVEGPILYAHFPEEYEEIYEAFLALEPSVKAHLLQEGPLWDLVQEHPLDIEFYEAVHLLELDRYRDQDTRRLNEALKSPRVKQKIHTYIQDLELE